MKSIEKVAKTVDEAVTEALIELSASTDQVDIEVISKGSKGFMGIGAKKAKVKVTLKEKIEEDFTDLLKEEPQTEPTVVEEKPVVELPKDISQYKESKKDSEDSIVVTKHELDVVLQRAVRFLEKLLKEMNVSGTIKTQIINNNRISIDIEGNNMGVIIGKRGETLDAIQYIVNIVANKERKEYVKIMIDTEDYRARREQTLRKLAYKLSKKAQQTKKPIILEPMNPYDRRIIHSALQESKIVKTHSEGKEPFRRVVISPYYPNRSSR